MTQQSAQSTKGAKVKERQELRRRMAVQRQVELLLNSIIERMVKLVDEETQVSNSRMEKHQMKNLLSVALETPSVEVVKHFILYQVGRDTSGSSWRHKNFGRTLVRAIDALRKDADRITRQVHRELRLDEPTDEQVDAAWMDLTRAYLGHLNRYFYFRKEESR